MIRYRSPETVKKKIDQMLKKSGKVILDHGVGNYEFTRYEYDEPGIDNGFQSVLWVFYRDFDDGKEKLFMKLTEDNLRKPTKDDYYVELIHCGWEKKYPTLLEMREYYVGR